MLCRGKETPIVEADYVLRAAVLPEGKHQVEFKFHPDSYFMGNKISMASSILLILAMAGYLIVMFKTKK